MGWAAQWHCGWVWPRGGDVIGCVEPAALNASPYCSRNGTITAPQPHARRPYRPTAPHLSPAAPSALGPSGCTLSVS